MTSSTSFFFGASRHGLSLFIGADGHPQIAAELASIYGPAVYYASR
jgi:hypothetical protein